MLSKVEKNPKLIKQLEDVRFSQALTAFQKNPQEAMLAVQNDPEVKEFIQEFCGLLGEHFTTLGEEEMKKVNVCLIYTLMKILYATVVSIAKHSLEKDSISCAQFLVKLLFIRTGKHLWGTPQTGLF